MLLFSSFFRLRWFYPCVAVRNWEIDRWAKLAIVLCCRSPLLTMIRSTPSKLTNQCAGFLQPATNIFVAGQVDHARWKTRNIDPKHATKQCCATSWGFLYLVFRRLNWEMVAETRSYIFRRRSRCRRSRLCLSSLIGAVTHTKVSVLSLRWHEWFS